LAVAESGLVASEPADSTAARLSFADGLRAAVNSVLDDQWAQTGGVGTRPPVEDDENFFDLPYFDSFALVDLIMLVESRIGAEVELWDLDPERIFTIGGLLEFAQLQAAKDREPSDRDGSGARAS
jgi:acyl carrier protein